MNSPGGIRASQLISTFGPGSIVDFMNDSVMIMGLQDWSDDEINYKKIFEPRLSNRLNVRAFREPISQGKEGGVPCISFPRYYVCPACKSLKKDFPRYSNGVPYCDCRDRNVQVHPARFVMACANGHIDDFPWNEWCHFDRTLCKEPVLKLKTRGDTASLSDMLVSCTCGASRLMSNALKQDALSKIGVHCTGSSPWIRKRTRRCDKAVRGLQRGASNVYFASTISALSIPPWSDGENDHIDREIDEKWPDIVANIETHGISNLKMIIQFSFPRSNEEKQEKLFHKINERYYEPEKGEDIRLQEWEAFQETAHNSDHFHIEQERVDPSISRFVSRIVLAHRLREVRVLRGFTRIDYPDPYNYEELNLSYLSSGKVDWLPAVEVMGEGIFVQLNECKVKQWENSVSQESRLYRLIEYYQAWRARKGWKRDERISIRFILLHSLAHALIRELSLSCGYSSNSIRERIYAGSEMCGVLLYTASPDSDGSLGGIIQQGRTTRFPQILKQAIERAKICSSDPLCSEMDTSIENRLNLAACHACQFVSETSCEWSNRLLDRRVLFCSDDDTLGFFNLQPSEVKTG